MKKILMILMLVVLTGGMAMAQNSRRSNKRLDPKERAERMTERMAKEYSLNDAQKKQLYEANLGMTEKMGDMPMRRHPDMQTDSKQDKVKRADKKQMTDAERKEMKAKMEKKHAEMKQAREAYDVQLKKIMTKEQYEAYSRKQGERRMNARGRG